MDEKNSTDLAPRPSRLPAAVRAMRGARSIGVAE